MQGGQAEMVFFAKRHKGRYGLLTYQRERYTGQVLPGTR